MQTQQQQHGGDRNVTGNSISANSLPSSPKYPIRIFRITKMPMARNLKNKQSRVQNTTWICIIMIKLWQCTRFIVWNKPLLWCHLKQLKMRVNSRGCEKLHDERGPWDEQSQNTAQGYYLNIFNGLYWHTQCLTVL